MQTSSNKEISTYSVCYDLNKEKEKQNWCAAVEALMQSDPGTMQVSHRPCSKAGFYVSNVFLICCMSVLRSGHIVNTIYKCLWKMMSKNIP